MKKDTGTNTNTRDSLSSCQYSQVKGLRPWVEGVYSVQRKEKVLISIKSFIITQSTSSFSFFHLSDSEIKHFAFNQIVNNLTPSRRVLSLNSSLPFYLLIFLFGFHASRNGKYDA